MWAWKSGNPNTRQDVSVILFAISNYKNEGLCIPKMKLWPIKNKTQTEQKQGKSSPIKIGETLIHVGS